MRGDQALANHRYRGNLLHPLLVVRLYALEVVVSTRRSRDTLTVAGFLFVKDRPGQWLFHDYSKGLVMTVALCRLTARKVRCTVVVGAGNYRLRLRRLWVTVTGSSYIDAWRRAWALMPECERDRWGVEL